MANKLYVADRDNIIEYNPPNEYIGTATTYRKLGGIVFLNSMNKVVRKKQTSYTTISNVFLRDKNLSIKAKGFLAVVMGLPEKWDFSIKGICSILKEGKTAIYNVIQELKEYHYCETNEIRNEKGLYLGLDYVFYEEPHICNPQQEYPYAENQHTDNEPQYNKEYNGNKERNNETNKKEERDKSLSKKDDLFEECWKKYRRGRKSEAFKQWVKLTEKEKIKVREHIKYYLDAAESLQFVRHFERYLSKKTFNDIVVKGNIIIYDPEKMEDTNGYHPSVDGISIFWLEEEKMYGTVSCDLYNIFDGYDDDKRPASARLKRFGSTIRWDVEKRKWIEE